MELFSQVREKAENVDWSSQNRVASESREKLKKVMGCFRMHSGASLAVAIILLLLLGCQAAASSVGPSSSVLQHHQTRKLLNNTAAAAAATGHAGGYIPRRTSPDGCSDQDVEVYQNTTASTSGGIPIYSVEIINVCTGCTVYNVHVSCGNFASTELVNPALFRRLSVNDCLVNNGGPMGPGDTVSFEYSNSFAYPLSVASVSCR